MLHISSRDNPLYKRLMRLAQGRRDRHVAEREEGVSDLSETVMLEGIHLCQEWLKRQGQPVQAVFNIQLLQTSAELQDLARQLDNRLAVSMDNALIQPISQIATGQGVFFLVNYSAPALPERIKHSCIWLDRIQDPGNVGTLLRTAAAAGIAHAYLSEECARAWSPRVLRSAQGAHFALTIYEQVSLLDAHKRLSIPLYATALDDHAVSLYDGQIPAPCAWVFGNEGQGVDPRLLAVADQRVYIPQEPAVESLNVAIAAGICLFEQRRQQRDYT